MKNTVSVRIGALEDTLHWTSVNAGVECRAFVCRSTGAVYFDSGDAIELACEVPPDVLDVTRYAAAPNKIDLNLGRALRFDFIDQHAPTLSGAVRDVYSSRGANARFKNLLMQHGLLAQWYDFEANETRRALTNWASEEGFLVID